VVVPSPVHYDRAGRRVIDPSWQEQMYRMIREEREAERQDAPAPEAPAEPEAGPERVRETVILVPGPALRRIRGTLTVGKGMLALEDAEGVIWYLPGLDRYIGFIEGLEAGEDAALEGYAPARGSSQERYFQAVRLFLDEMDYDLAIPPEGLYLGGQTTVIREIERLNGPALRDDRGDRGGAPGNGTARRDDGRDRGGNPGTETETGTAYRERDRDRAPMTGARAARPEWDDEWDDEWDGLDEEAPAPARRARRPRNGPPGQPAWQHRHKSPWAPPTSVMDFEMDYDALWRPEDPAREERRERDSREIWY
jgi:hypothetical protein